MGMVQAIVEELEAKHALEIENLQETIAGLWQDLSETSAKFNVATGALLARNYMIEVQASELIFELMVTAPPPLKQRALGWLKGLREN